MKVYYALVESHLRYASVVWGSLSDTKMEALQRLENRAFDIIDSSRFQCLWERRSLNVNQVINFDRSLMTYKIVDNLCPEILQNKFQEGLPFQNIIQETKETCIFKGLTQGGME